MKLRLLRDLHLRNQVMLMGKMGGAFYPAYMHTIKPKVVRWFDGDVDSTGGETNIGIKNVAMDGSATSEYILLAYSSKTWWGRIREALFG